MVRGAWIAAVAQPLMLSIGAILAAIDLDVLDIQPIQWKNRLFSDKKDEGGAKGEAEGGSDMWKRGIH